MSFSFPWLRSHNLATAGNLLVRFLLCCVLCVVTALPAPAQPLKETLIIAISNDFHPLTFINTAGEPAGMFVDMWRLWGEKNGQKIEFIASDWKTSLENLQNGKADIHSGLIFSPLRSRWMSETRSIYQSQIRFFHPWQQGKVDDFDKLSGETVAVVRGTEPEEYLRRNHPGIRVVSCAGREELLRVTRSGQAQGFLALAPVGVSLIDHHGVSGKFERSGTVLYSEDFHPGVLKENQELAAYIDNGLSAITPKELAKIEARWIADPAQRYFKSTGRVDLTTAEELWLKDHPTIRVGMSPVLPPLKFSEDGVIKGVEPDYLQELAARTGLQFKYVVCPFAEMDAKVKAGELDMFLSFNIPERLDYMRFTEPFMDFKQIVIARSDAPFIGALTALNGKRVATIKGVKLHEKVLKPYPEIQAVPFATMEEAFRAVAQGKADALLSKTLFAGYLMARYPNLKIAGVLDLPPEPYLYAVRQDYPELVGILNKAITAIPREKHDSLQQKWHSVKVEYRPNWTEFRKWALFAGGGVVIILGLTLYWNRRLGQEVARQKQTEAALQKSQSLLNETGRIARIGGWELEVETLVLVWTEEVSHIHEVDVAYHPTVETSLDFYLPASRSIIATAVQRAIDFGESYDLNLEILTAKGNQRWVHAVGTAIQKDGKTKKIHGTFQDISERKQMDEALTLNNTQLNLVLEGSQLGFWDWNIVTGKVDRNARWAEMLGYTLAEVELNVKQWTDLIHPDDRERAWRSIQDHLEVRTPCHAIEYRMRTKDGRFLWILDQARIVERDADNRPQRMSGTHTDITDRKLTEQLRIRAQVENEERSRMARELHDGSGQALLAIRLHLQLLAAGKGSGDLHVELGELARSVAETASELRDLSHQLHPSYLQEVTLDAALLDRCNLLTRRGLPVSLDCAGDFSALPDQVSNNFYRVFQEAVTNAFRHAGAKGIKIDLTRSESRLSLSVSDDGHGIDERTSGHGIGLQIMQERATLIGATLSISSNASGTTVTLTQEGI